MVNQRILLIPNLRRDRGFGHLRRCMDLLKDLGDLTCLYWPPQSQENGGDQFTLAEWPYPLPRDQILRDLSEGTFDVILMDNQISDMTLLHQVRTLCPLVICWDEGGPGRAWADYLIDSLPNDKRDPGNLVNRSFLGLEPQKAFINRPIQKVLVSFGGADPGNLTPRFLKFLQKNLVPGLDWEITLVEGPFFKFPLVPDPRYKILKSPGSLSQILPQYDLFIGSFGLSALEAVRAGVPAVLLNPTGYHRKLSRAWGFPEIGVGYPRQHLWGAALLNLKDSWQLVQDQLNQGEGRLADLLKSFHAGQPGCPVCHSRQGKALARYPGRTFFECQNCSMVYMRTFNQPPKQYNEAYFFEDYEKQYGKTYLEDFDHIKTLGLGRLSRIQALGTGKKLLDIGCAYGPFLAAAKTQGFDPEGLDISQAAVKYVTETLGFKAQALSFLDLGSESQAAYDVVTLWYVIEHFEDLNLVMKKLNSLVKVGGVLALSTPNFRGITGIFTPQKFFETSPWDHFSLWTPKNARRTLKTFGFRVENIVPTGIHPERFPGMKHRSGFRWSLVKFLARIFCWGDTFEIYARKERNLE